MTARPTPTPALTAAVEEFTAKWRSVAVAEETAPALGCQEINALARLFRVAGVPDAADEWTAEHTANEPECWGHPAPEPPQFDEHGNYTPAPGTEYPFSVSDISRATAKLLGQGWMAESGYWGVSGVVSGPYNATFDFLVDHDGDLCVTYSRYEDDGFAEHPDLPEDVGSCDEGVYLVGASASDGLDDLAERAAAAIRAVSGYDPADFDFESSASRQHHIDTGRYLRKGEAETV